jgi:hypothetical protein
MTLGKGHWYGNIRGVASIEGDSLASIEGDSLASIEGDSLASIEGDSLASIEGDSLASIEGAIFSLQKEWPTVLHIYLQDYEGSISKLHICYV